MEPAREIMTPEQVAEYLQLDRETIYRYIRSGKLVAARFGRAYRVSKKNVDRFFQANSTQPRFVPRDYSDEEIKDFLAEDQLTDEEIRILDQYAKRHR